MQPDKLAISIDLLLARRREQAQFRRRVCITPIDSTHIEVDGRRFVNFASNDYLGLSHHPRLLQALADALVTSAGSGAAGLVTGYTSAHRAAELALANWKQSEASILLPSGYQANLAAIQTLATIGESGIKADGVYNGAAGEKSRGVRFLLDKLVHASLIDAVRATGQPMRVFPHNHLAKLARLLAEAAPGEMQVVVTESIFSMDGDAADLPGLAKLKSRQPFVLFLDEAHGSGVYGLHGSGLAAELGLAAAVDVTVVTLSKALGYVGGAICATRGFCDAVLNAGRAYIYSTSVPPSTAVAVQTALAICKDEPERQARLRRLVQRVRGELAGLKLNVPEGHSPIIPIILGREQAALDSAEQLKGKGLYVLAIRPPTVPKDQSRLRVTLSCDHSEEEIDQLMLALRSLHL